MKWLDAINRGFMGNRRIHRAGIPIEFTAEQMIEIAKCMADPIYFFDNYVKIKHIDHENLIPFNVRSYQAEMVDKILNNREVIVKLPRQCGKTICVSALVLWHVLFKKNYSVLVAAHKADKSREVLAQVKGMFEELPYWLQMGVKEWTKGFISFENGSRVKSSATTASSARGDTYNMIYLDEFAFVEEHLADGFIKSVMPTISAGKTSKTIITSTPQGLNHFHTIWEMTVQGKNNYKHVEIKWNDVPGRDEEFRDGIIANFGQAYFDQEYGAEFIGSGKTLIVGHVLQRMSADVVDPVNTNNKTRLFAKPEKGRHYAVCVDVAEGLGGDCSAAVVLDITTLPYTIACVYQNNEVDEVSFSGIVHDLGKAYNEAMILVESNFGSTVGRILWEDLEYENLIRTVRKKDMQNLRPGETPRSRNGVRMDVSTKRIGCSSLKLLVEQDQLKVCDEKIYNELKRFSVDGKTYRAEEGYDDLAMCLVLFGWMADQGYLKDLTDTNARTRIAQQNRDRIENETLPLGFKITGDGHEQAAETGRWETRAAEARWHNDHLDTVDFPRAAEPDYDRIVDPDSEWSWSSGWTTRKR